MIIIDDKLNPYEIHITHTEGYAIKKEGKLDKHGDKTYSIYGYFSSIGGAVNKIAKLKCESKKDVVTLNEYLVSFREIKNDLLDIAKSYEKTTNTSGSSDTL